MRIEFDPAKDAANVSKHYLSLKDFRGFDGPVLGTLDQRYDYGEPRYRAFGRINGSGYCLVYTVRRDVLRLISFRRAHEKEMSRHE